MRGLIATVTAAALLVSATAPSAHADVPEHLNLGLVASQDIEISRQPLLASAGPDRRIAADEKLDPMTGEAAAEGLGSKQRKAVIIIAAVIGGILTIGLIKKYYDEGIDLQRAPAAGLRF